jgi:hypothetical protein
MESLKPSTWHEYSCEICGSRFESADKLSREERLCSGNCEREYYRGLDDAAYEAAREDNFDKYR